MGKPIAHSRGEVQSTLTLIEHYCDKAAEWLAPEEMEGGVVHYEPLGVAAVISPWNFPMYVPFTAIPPALLAGNAVVFKPSEYTLRTGIEIGKLFTDLEGFPEGAFKIVVGGKEHGSAVVDQDVQMVSFTGSTRVGKEIMKRSSEEVRQVLLELGGLDAAIVLKDADISKAAKKIVQNNCTNTGQVCCAVKRVFVEREVYDDFVSAAAKESEAITYGDPQTEVDMGPLVADFQRKKVEEILDDAKSKGAKVLTGGEAPEGKGYYFPSTVLADVNHDMRIMHEEPFGPLLPIFAVDSWEEAVEHANDTPFGLTGSVWSSDTAKGEMIAGKLEVGVAGVNCHGGGGVGSPFGGAKQSGIGRTETKDGMRAFTNVKLVRIK